MTKSASGASDTHQLHLFHSSYLAKLSLLLFLKRATHVRHTRTVGARSQTLLLQPALQVNITEIHTLD